MRSLGESMIKVIIAAGIKTGTSNGGVKTLIGAVRNFF